MTELPRDASGFRLRGLAMTRVETFTDAAFAFALTLLVVSLEPPTDIAALRQALLGVPAFLFQEGDDPNATRAFKEIARLMRPQGLAMTDHQRGSRPARNAQPAQRRALA